MAVPGIFSGGARYLLYLPRLLIAGPAELRSDRVATLEGTVLFADVSGFTALSEQLAKEGKVGSERVTEIINGAFTELLTVSRLEGGDLISFGGDATLLLFTGEDHARRAATAAFEMREALADYAEAEAPVPLSVTQGIASGKIIAVAAGTDSRQLLLVGDVIDEMSDLESVAENDEIRISDPVAAALGLSPSDSGTGIVLNDAPEPSDYEPTDEPAGEPGDLSQFIPREIRDELLLSGAQGEHRPAVVGFIRAEGVGQLLAEGGPTAARDGLDELVDTVVQAAQEHDVTLLSSDVSRDGVKLIVTAGVPRAMPQPEERMLRTLRRVVETEMPLRLHIGAATGDVFSGDLGAAFRRGYTVMGDTVNLAARLAGKAESAQLLTTRRVFENCRTSFEIRELPPVELKGKALPLTPLEVGSILSTPMAEAMVSGPLIGRHDQMAVIEEAVENLGTGRGAVIEVTGDVGIGKSRLLLELPGVAPDLEPMLFECEEYEAATPYRAAGLLLRRLTDLTDVESATEAGQRLHDLIEERVPSLLPWLPLLGTAVGARVEMTDEVEALAEEFRLARLFEVVGELLEALIPQPTVVAFDNTQWMDPASSELLHDVMMRQNQQPWLWIWAHRGEPDSMPSELGVTVMALDRLTDDESRQLVRSLRPDTMPMRLDEIVDRAGGNPLFLSELATSPPEVGVPDSVERLLAARIDGLGPRERRLLREASVIGQQFDLDLLVESLGSDTPGVDDPTVWEHLGEFLSFGSTGKVRFVQPLIRDVAYEGLPFRRRRQLHATVGETIERRARHRANRQAAVLSLHYFHAGAFDKAWKYASIGGNQAAEKYANREAVVLYERALDAAQHSETVDDAERASVAESLGDTAELAADYERARSAYDQAEEYGDGSRLSELDWKRALLHEKAGEYREAIELLEAALSHGASEDESEARAMTALAGVRYRQGDYESSADWARKALDRTAESGSAVEAHARYLLSLNQTHLGDPARLDNARVALGIYEGLSDWVGAGKVLNNLGIDAYYQGDWTEAVELYTRSRNASERAGDVHMMAMQDNNLAEIYSDQGQLDRAEELFRQTESIWGPARFEAGIALVTSNQGRLLIRRGQVEEGIKLLEEALDRFTGIGAEAYIAETRLRLIEAELHREPRKSLEMLEDLVADLGDASAARTLAASLFRMRGHALAILGDVEGAKEALDRALETAASDDARYELGLAGCALGALGEKDKGEECARILEELGAEEAVLPPLP